jgi:formylglycine-generating enzyme required for sulfatase activity
MASTLQVPSPVLIPVPGGGFSVGSEAGRPDETPVHRVKLEPFAIGRTPVTNAEYAEFLAAKGVTEPPWWGEAGFSEPDQPVVGVTWFEAAAYARWLSRMTRRTWRLPTEAEWERAVRGGLEGRPTAWGDALPPAEVPEGPIDGPWPVGCGTPNGYGLLDAGTIVHEWCLDWYDGSYYSRSPEYRPRGAERGQRRSSRGGSWRHRVRWSPPAARSSLPPGFRYSDYGFRVLCEDLRPVPSASPSRPAGS